MKEAREKLLKDGFKKVYTWEDKPNEFYKKHNHPYDTKLIILEGSMKITLNDNILELKSGDEIHIKTNEMHEVTIGKNGCKYLVGEVK